MSFHRGFVLASAVFVAMSFTGRAATTAALMRPGAGQAAVSRVPAAGNACPARAVFLRLFGEMRGYPLEAQGQTTPCTDVAGKRTLLEGNGNGYGAIQIDADGRPNALAFQSNGYGGLLIFKANANGNAPPLTSVLVDQDHVALATDAELNDFVVASQGYQADSCWYVVPAGQTMPSLSNCDANVDAIYALASDPAGELAAVGFDTASGDLRVDFFTGAATASPTLVRTIEGSATNFPVSTGSYFAYSFQLAADPRSGELYVYIGGPTLGSPPPSNVPLVEEFAADASGNAAPIRTIAGALTGLPASAFGADVLALDDRSRLYVSSSVPSIAVFGAHQHGNVAPERTISDSSAKSQQTAVGIAVRTSR